MTSEVALLGASALHAGFQLVVTLVVYPALADVPVDGWARAHDAHSRRISVVVGIVYVVTAAACLWLLVAGPRTPLTLLAVAGNALAALTTATVAAPLHGRLGRSRTDARVARLLAVDRVRLVATLGALVAAALAV